MLDRWARLGSVAPRAVNLLSRASVLSGLAGDVLLLAAQRYLPQLSPVSFRCCCFQAEDGIRDKLVTGVQTCALPISSRAVIPVSSSLNSRGPVEEASTGPRLFSELETGITAREVVIPTIGEAEEDAEVPEADEDRKSVV